MILILSMILRLSNGSSPFTVVSGTCTLKGKCIHSPNYPNKHDNNERCTVKVQNVASGEKISSALFNTESCCDKLTVISTQYKGQSLSNGPNNVAVSVNDEILWYSDGSVIYNGFQVCLVATCSNTDATASNNGGCQCGNKVCTYNTGFYCVSSSNTCSKGSSCTVTDGSTLNSVDCSCGTASCNSVTGHYCMSSINKCSTSVITSCSDNSGMTASTVACICGTNWCNSDNGFFCTSSINVCATGPPCSNTDGTVANLQECRCGQISCSSSAGLICYSTIGIGSCRKTHLGKFGYGRPGKANSYEHFFLDSRRIYVSEYFTNCDRCSSFNQMFDKTCDSSLHILCFFILRYRYMFGCEWKSFNRNQRSV